MKKVNYMFRAVSDFLKNLVQYHSGEFFNKGIVSVRIFFSVLVV